jgi:hypothetical protein
MTAFWTSKHESSNMQHAPACAATSTVSHAAQAQTHTVSCLTSINVTIQHSASTSSVTHVDMTLRTPTPTIHNQPSIEKLTAQHAKALKEDWKDALHKLEHYEHEPVTFNMGEHMTDLIWFWEVSSTFPSHNKGTKVNFSIWRKSIHYFSVLLWMSCQLRHHPCCANVYFHPAKKYAHSVEADSHHK